MKKIVSAALTGLLFGAWSAIGWALLLAIGETALGIFLPQIKHREPPVNILLILASASACIIFLRQFFLKNIPVS